MGRKSERVGMGIKIKKYEDIFDVPADKDKNENNESSGAVFVDPAFLKEFEGHPFKVIGKGIDELMDSIREQGILSPLIVRPVDGEAGIYEIISGHRRRYCAVQLGIREVPVIIREIDDNDAVLAMVDSNIQREDILPSEKAFAYKMKLEAIKRQGERTDLSEKKSDENLTSGQVVRKLESADIVGRESKESGRQIRRYIKLTELPKYMLDAVDSKRMSFNAGVEISYLSEEGKAVVLEAARAAGKLPSLEQAKKIRELLEKNSETKAEDIAVIIGDKKINRSDINLERKEIREFFPKSYTPKQIEEAIIEILKGWKWG